MCGAVNMLPGTAGVSWCSVTLRGRMCGAVNMLPGTAGVSWCSVTLRGRVFTCVELSRYCWC